LRFLFSPTGYSVLSVSHLLTFIEAHDYLVL
jgi:hypothetical protein